MGRITITIEEKNPDLIWSALDAEIRSAPFVKSKILSRREEGKVIIQMESENMAALRGTFNSVMNWLIVILAGMKERF
jgi:tRNA threonylcarbamoyladenosine modification (KEOPS) complex  Pcc1 subunit